MESLAPAVVTYRGEHIENTHFAHIAVVDAEGRLLLSWGNPRRMTLARSAAKPAQALAVIETGAPDQFAFSEADLALMCGSHSSEERHIAGTVNMLRTVGATEADLRCGGHPPISDAVHHAWIKRDFSPTPACSNCSGKHAGMLAGALALTGHAEGYHLPSHPMQRHVMHVMEELCGTALGWATDGCNFPTPAFPLERLAVLYARLAQAADLAPTQAQTEPRTKALRRLYQAMTCHPEMVAGEGRYCTELMRTFEGDVVGKVGADGSYGLGIRACEQTRQLGTDGAIGVAIKVEDGNVGVTYLIVGEVLERLGIGTPEQRSRLETFHRPKILNTMGQEVGHQDFPFVLRSP